jgi:eukaryotic-like serine/threonine-protein kinase
MSLTDDAAQNLLGIELEDGWKVIKKIDKVPGQTGSFFSVCYLIEKDGDTLFLKAFDFMKFQKIAESGKKAVDIMTDMLNAHRYERDISLLCKNRHLDKIVTVRHASEILVAGHAYPLVPYLIFDLADGDVRKIITFADKLDTTWKLKSLHDVAVGLKQLHSIDISHQDLKPSNVLLYSGESKLADIGRSQCKNMSSPYDGIAFTGDSNYAPPEILYGSFDSDWATRTYSADLYLLGSMIVFYFCGISMTALLRKNMHDSLSWDFWRGSYEEVKEYLLDGFQKSLAQFSESIKNDELRRELNQLVRQLCHPFPDKRGHPKDMTSDYAKFNLHRYISKLDMLKRKAEFKLINE